MSLITTTYLEMCSPHKLRPKLCTDDRFSISEVKVPQWQFNRFLYLAVGADWSWNDKRDWTDAQWQAYSQSPQLRTFAAYHDGAPAGYYELHHHDDGSVEIAYFGILQPYLGRGFGGALLTSALEQAWQMSPTRVWVHTCTLDHPSALANYQARGMEIYEVKSSP